MKLASGLRRMSDELGVAGLAAFGLLAGGALFLFLVLKPLEARNDELDRRLERSVPQDAALDPARMRAATPAAKLEAFYRFFETEEKTTDWLARLHSIGKAAGVVLRAADYRMQRTGTPIERYEIVLPIAGGYAQIRAFLKNALTEIPVLSLDQVNFRRARANDAVVQADVRLTLHLVKP
jgi:Tfp pilus assembly protein PilO